MKILQVCSHFHPCTGGIESYTKDLCINLKKMGHISDVVCLNTCPHSTKKLETYSKYQGTKIFRIPFLPFKYYQIAPSALKFVDDYEIVHLHGLRFFSDYLSLTKIFHKKPLVLSTHGGIFHTTNIMFLKKIYFNHWFKILNKFVDTVIAHSKNDQKLFSQVSDPIYIPYSIYFDRYNIDKKAEKNSMLFVGRLSENKRVEKLLETFSYLRNYENLKLYIVGDGEEKKELIAKKEDLGLGENVKFVGEKKVGQKGEDLLHYYSKAEYFLSASRYEGFGISTIEAMAAGCIPIVNNIEAFKKFVHHGKNGFLVDYNNPQKVANEIKGVIKLKKNEKKRVVENTKIEAKKYDWGKTMEKIETVYLNLLEENKRVN